MAAERPWYLLIHQLPARPLYLRARVRKLLDDAGAVALKRAVYALPQSPHALEVLVSIADDIHASSGEAFVLEAKFTSSRDSKAVADLHRAHLTAEYRRIAAAARASRRDAELARLRERLVRMRAVDLSPAGAESEALAAIEAAERRVSSSSLSGKTWVTRRGLHVDRLACAWVIRRFIDRGARFRFADPRKIVAAAGELTFDVPEANFGHENGECSVETLIRKAGIRDAAVRRIAEIVHDIDLKDGRFGHPETAGVERMVSGIAQGHQEDRARLARGLALFDDLYRASGPAPSIRLTGQRKPPAPRRSRVPNE